MPRGRASRLAWAGLVAGLALTTRAEAQAAPASCQLFDARAAGATGPSDLYATCPAGALHLGDATNYASAANVATGLLVVSRQTGLGTQVDLVKLAPDGSTQLEELAGELQQALAQAGAGRPATFGVDLSSFAVEGVITAATLPGSASPGSVQINLLARALQTVSAPAQPAPG